MGCTNLWRYLSSVGVIQNFDGTKTGDYERILKLVDGKYLAIDVAVWGMEVNSISGLRQSLKSYSAALLKVVFEKILTMLRMGCTPVIVLEGVVDASKYKLMEKRYKRPYNPKQGVNRHGMLLKLISALGLECVQAPGEGEATCAALESIGLVDGCITRDSDVLAFGGQTIYKTFSLSIRSVKQNRLEMCLLSDVRKLFGISTGGTQSMQLVTLLNGGDYNLGGTEQVGIIQASKTVQSLLRNKDSDLDLIDDFWDQLLSEQDEVEQAPSKSCTGCRCCGCEGYGKGRRIASHKKLGCVGCGTQPKELGGNGEGGCIPMKEGDFCKCVYCTWKRGEGPVTETMLRVLDKERRQSMQHTTLQQALKAYSRQREKALNCVSKISSRSELRWQRRPDFDTLKEMFDKQLNWDAITIREKLIPLLLEWDLAHSKDPDIEFKAVKITGMNSKGKRSGNQHSAIDVEFERVQGINQEFEDFDRSWLQEKTRNGKWSVRKTLVDAHCAGLLQEFEESKKLKKKTKRDAGCMKITDFLEMDNAEPDLKEIDDSSTSLPTQHPFETPRKVPKGSSLLNKDHTSASKRQQTSQKDIRGYCSSVSGQKEPLSESESSFSKRFGSAARRLTFLSIYSDDSDQEVSKTEPSNEEMEVEGPPETNIVDLLTPIPMQGQRHSDGTIIDLLTPDRNS